MKNYKKNLISIAYLLIIFFWIPIEIILFSLIDWQSCANHINSDISKILQGKYLHYITLITLDLFGIFFFLKKKNYLITFLILINFYYFIILYSINDDNLLDNYNFRCSKILNKID